MLGLTRLTSRNWISVTVSEACVGMTPHGCVLRVHNETVQCTLGYSRRTADGRVEEESSDPLQDNHVGLVDSHINQS